MYKLTKDLIKLKEASKNMTTDNFDKNLKDYEKRNTPKKKKSDDLRCPVCKSYNNKHVVLEIMEGTPTVGGKISMHRITEYHVCQICGVMFVDLNK